jgi:hypothetical protein
MAFFFFLVSGAVGGDEFADSIGGYYTLIVLLGSVAVGAALKIIPRHGEGSRRNIRAGVVCDSPYQSLLRNIGFEC